MDELKIVNLNGKEYAVLDEIQTGNIIYIYFVNPNNLIDFCIRKLADEQKEVLLSLDSREEFEYAINLFKEKNQETFN